MLNWRHAFVFGLILFVATAYSIPSLKACSWGYLIWQKSPKSDTPLFRFVTKDERAGYIDKNGNIVIPAKYRYWGNSGGDFFNGLAVVKNQDGGEIIDATGKTITVVEEFRTSKFSEGLSSVRLEQASGNSFKTGFIGKDGQLVIPAQFDSARGFSDGLAVAEIEERYGYIDRTGKFVIQPKFPKAWDFSDGFARVITKGDCSYFDDTPCLELIRVPRHPRQQLDEQQKTPRCEFSFINKQGELFD